MTPSTSNEVTTFLRGWAQRCLTADNLTDLAFVAGELQQLVTGLRQHNLTISEDDLRHHPLVVILSQLIATLTTPDKLILESMNAARHWAAGDFSFDSRGMYWMQGVNIERVKAAATLGMKGGEAHDSRCICWTCLQRDINEKEK